MPQTTYSSKFVWEGERVTRGAARGAARGVNRALHYLRALSVPLAPIDTGALRESASVKEASPLRPEGALVFDTPYAARQHEELDYHHDDGQAKYVEQPMNEHQNELRGIIAKEVTVGILRS